MILGSSFWYFPVKFHQKNLIKAAALTVWVQLQRRDCIAFHSYELLLQDTTGLCGWDCVESWLCFLFKRIQLYIGVILTFLISIRDGEWSFCLFCCEIWSWVAHPPSTQGLACSPPPAEARIQAEVVFFVLGRAWSWCVFPSITSCQVQQTFSLGSHLNKV